MDTNTDGTSDGTTESTAVREYRERNCVWSIRRILEEAITDGLVPPYLMRQHWNKLTLTSPKDGSEMTITARLTKEGRHHDTTKGTA